MIGLRLPFRMARREVRRRPGRTFLVVVLIGLPVAGMAIALTAIRTSAVTPAEQWQRQFGQADAMAGGIYGALPIELEVVLREAPPLVQQALPEGARSLRVQSTGVRLLSSEGRRSHAEVSDLPLLDPMTEGIHELVDGRAATRDGEVVLSLALARHMQVEVGERLVLDRPDLSWTVVGILEPIGCLSCDYALVPAGSLPGPGAGAMSGLVLIDLPSMDRPQLVALEQQGTGIEVRDLVLDRVRTGRPDQGGVRWSLVLGAVALTVAGIVISAAFAVGARRQLVTLGQLSASGASPTTIRSALVLQGTIAGLVGAGAGLVLWGLALGAGRGLFERLLDMRIEHYEVPMLQVAVAVLLGVGAATAAALLPARSAAGIPTLAALAGRRPLAPVSRKQVGRGLLAFVGGLGLLALAVVGSNSGQSGDTWGMVAIAGGVSELLGACALAPVVVGRLEPLASRLRGPWRLGARGLARHRARTGAVVSAVAAAGALAVAAAGLFLGAEARFGIDVRVPDDVVVVIDQAQTDDGPEARQVLDPDTLDQLRTVLPGSTETTLRVATVADAATGSDYWSVSPATGPGAGGPSPIGGSGALIADEGLLRVIRADRDVRGALRDHGLVALTPLGAGPATISLPDGRVLDGALVTHPFIAGYTSQILITADRAVEIDAAVVAAASAFTSPDPLTEGQRDRLEDIQSSGSSDERFLSVQWSSPSTGPTPFQLELMLTGVALVFSLFVVGVSLALAAAEAKDERDVLTVAGAPPAALARSAGAKAWLLAGIGGAMAIPVGFLPVVVYAVTVNDGVPGGGFPIVFPTRTVALLVLAIPAVVALASFLASATAQRLRPVRVSTATFE